MKVKDDNSIVYDISLSNYQKNYNSIIHIGDLTIYNTKKFNKLNKLMINIFFGIIITDKEE